MFRIYASEVIIINVSHFRKGCDGTLKANISHDCDTIFWERLN